MTKMNKQKEIRINSKEQALTESKSLRDEAISTINADFLDKIKAVEYLTSDMIISIEQIANYYEVSKKSIETIISRNRDEFESDGMLVLVGDELKEFKQIVNAPSNEGALIGAKVNSYTILTKRSLLRVGMILTNCAMATRIRNYLLNIEEEATQRQKQRAIAREVGTIDRNRMTSAIKNFIPESPHKKFAYKNYTNMIYKLIFGKDAKAIRKERGLTKDSELTRDKFTEQELRLVDEAETIVTALVTLGFSYEYIKEQLEKKYIKALSS